ncbi:MAG TPA: hypothetical protein VGG19_20440 [Tepidisphaeraceae bacterium]|jgi:hypothetical protein
MPKSRLPFLLVLLLLAIFLRLWDFPHRYESRHGDEENYMIGSLHLLEGMTPPFKYAPAGPQTWAGWAYAGAVTTKDFVFPPANQRARDIRLRPFLALNDALFDIYTDESVLRRIWIIFAYPFVIWSVYEAFLMGERLGGLAGAVLLSGAVAFLPIFVELSNQARPYMLAWALAIIAISLIIRTRTRRGWIISAIFFGLAVGSRIDMLALLPIAWSEIWHQRKDHPPFKSWLIYHAIVLMTVLLIAPWILTNLIGNLRIIGTVRLSEASQGPVSKLQTALDLIWHQGFLIIPLFAFAALFLPRAGEKRPRLVLHIFLLLLAVSLLKATGFGLQHQGGPIIALMFLAAIGIGAIGRRWPTFALAVAVILLILPLLRSIEQIRLDHANYIPDSAIAWVEYHVPAETRIYTGSTLRCLLPTVQASNFLWAEVNDGNAWQKKFIEGMNRFHLDAADIPRALSDEDNLVERGQRRRWFILGSRPEITRPRYDIRLYHTSPIFGVQDVSTAFAQTGGVLIWRGSRSDREVQNLQPVIAWQNPANAAGTFIYVRGVKLVD